MLIVTVGAGLSGLVTGDDGDLLDRTRCSDRGKAHTRLPTRSALTARQFRGIVSAALEYLVPFFGCERASGSSGTQPLARAEHLDRPQIVGQPAHLDGLAHAPVQFW